MTDNGATMDLQLRDKLAIVTGSSKGIGHAIATSLAREGARVVVNGRSEASVTTAIDEIRALVPARTLHPFAGDLSRADVAEALIRAFPEPDILVNNLGIFEPVPFEQIPDDDWRRFFEVNVLSGVRLSRLVLAGMKARDWGRIVFISSESAVQIPTEMIHYGMTKTAQLAVSRGLAQLCAGTGVTVNSVLPGPTRSAGVEDFVAALSGGRPFEEAEQEFFKTARPTSLLRRFATTEEVANMVTYVCSPLSSATNGAALRVDGGGHVRRDHDARAPPSDVDEPLSSRRCAPGTTVSVPVEPRVCCSVFPGGWPVMLKGPPTCDAWSQQCGYVHWFP